jgi:DnaJ family protein C protein 7
VHKLRGNAAFHEGRYDAAAAEYTAGLAAASGAAAAALRAPRAVLHSNRAAAAQAQGRLLDAVADCAMALALDPSYARALQRRADALTSLGDAAGAARDFESLAAVAATPAEAAALRARAAATLAASRRPGAAAGPDHYAVLGVPPSASAAAIKSAYRAAALKHHPDKAAPEGGAGVRCAAESLFKLAAQAYAVLSDAALRRRYDTQRTVAQAQDAAAAAYAR